MANPNNAIPYKKIKELSFLAIAYTLAVASFVMSVINYVHIPGLPYCLLIFPFFTILDLLVYINKCWRNRKWPNIKGLFYLAKALLTTGGIIAFLVTGIPLLLFMPIGAAALETLISLGRGLWYAYRWFEYRNSDKEKAEKYGHEAFVCGQKFIYFSSIAVGITLTYIIPGFAIIGPIAFAIPVIFMWAHAILNYGKALVQSLTAPRPEEGVTALDVKKIDLDKSPTPAVTPTSTIPIALTHSEQAENSQAPGPRIVGDEQSGVDGGAAKP